MEENININTTDKRDLSEWLLKRAYAGVKRNLQNILHSVQFCGICLESSRKSFYVLDFSGFDKADDSIEDMMRNLFGEDVISNLPNDLICDFCQKQLRDSYLFTTQVKNTSMILISYLDQMSEQIDGIDEFLDKDSSGYANTVIVLQDLLSMKHKECDDLTGVGEELLVSDATCYADQNKYTCDVCEKSFDSKVKITNHIQRFHMKTQFQKRFSCPECDTTPCIHERYLHSVKMSGVYGKSSLKCIDCEYMTASKTYLIAHINKDHLNLFPHLCDICGQSFASKYNHKQHIRQYHEDIIRCKYCEKILSNTSRLDTHIESCRTVVREFKCNYCPASFDHTEKLEYHKHRHKDQIPCPMCSKIFPSNVSLNRHIRQAHDRPLYNPSRTAFRLRECLLCPATFKTLIELRRHLQNHSLDEQHHCRVCEKTFASRRKYKAHCRSWPHIRRANPEAEFRFKCDNCGVSFPSERLLENHKNVYHFNIKPYVCTECSKAFTTEIHLKYHMERHEGVKKYLCTECNKSLSTLSSLKKHILRQHSPEKPYPCEYCEKTFVNMSERDTHKSRNHFEKSFVCPICECKFHTRCNVRAHIKKVHLKGTNLNDFLQDNQHNERLVDIFRDRRKPFVEN